MSSRITTIYEKLVTIPDALWTGGNAKTRLFNQYELDKNPEKRLINGWAIQDLGTVEDETVEVCKLYDTHTFAFVLTRQCVLSEEQVDKFDDAYLLLKEDMVTLRLRLLKSDQLGIEDDVSQIKLGSVSGVEQVFAGKQNFLSLSCQFTVMARESL